MASAAEAHSPIHDPATVGRNEAADSEKKDSTSDLGRQHAENPTANADDESDRLHYEKYGTYERFEITEEDCYEELGFSFPTWKKWMILSIVFLVQVSMNFNTSLYSNAVGGIHEEFGVSAQAARLGAALFLITYAFGCELWAPWSEELGRWIVLQSSLFLVNIWQIPVGIAPNFATILVCRSLGGLSTAGGSVTLAMVADMWEANEQQYAVAFIVFSSVGGSVLGPIVGGFVEQFLAWRWNIWIQLIFGGAVQVLHAALVPETRTTVLMDRIAKKRRTEGDKQGKPVNIWGPNETKTFKERFNVHEILTTWMRPFRMFVTEPIVLVLSLLSGFSDAIIFMFLQSYALVFDQWHFKPFAIGLAFIAIGVGYFIAWFSFFPAIKRNERLRRERPGDEQAQYESRLWWLLYTAPCLPVGLIIFAWTSNAGASIHWMGPLVGSAIIGIANYAIYMATIDYMICAYGPYSASATGGNGWARDFLAGVLTLPATPFFQNIGSKNPLGNASTILFAISLLLVVSVYVIYWKGPVLRKRSPFAQQLSAARDETGGRRVSTLPGLYGSRAGSLAQQSVGGPTSRRGSIVRGVPGEHRFHQGVEQRREGMQQRMQRGNSASQVPAGIEQH